MYPSWSIYLAPDPAHLKFICYYLFSLYLTHVSTFKDQCCRAGPKLTSSGPGHGVGSGSGSGSGSVSQLREKKIIHKYKQNYTFKKVKFSSFTFSKLYFSLNLCKHFFPRAGIQSRTGAAALPEAGAGLGHMRQMQRDQIRTNNNRDKYEVGRIRSGINGPAWINELDLGESEQNK